MNDTMGDEVDDEAARRRPRSITFQMKRPSFRQAVVSRRDAEEALRVLRRIAVEQRFRHRPRHALDLRRLFAERQARVLPFRSARSLSTSV